MCLVSPPGLAVLLQADQSAGLVGDFSVQRFDETLFRLSHLVRACQSSETPADCAQVWIEVLREVSISERGSFWVTFRPAGGGPAIHTLFSYGKLICFVVRACFAIVFCIKFEAVWILI